MRWSPLLITLIFSATASHAAQVTCYNDDSQDVVNQEELRRPPWGGTAPIPAPRDCSAAPEVTIGSAGEVLVNGQVVYRGFDQAYEARVSPIGVVAIYTEQGNLFVYREGQLTAWYRGGLQRLLGFKMARNGNLIGYTDHGELVLGGREYSTGERVRWLYAAASGRLVALMSDGALIDQTGRTLYSDSMDPAVDVKVAADGTVVWRTQNGTIGSTRFPQVHNGRVEAAVSFKITPSGRVAYLTQDGGLWRDGARLSNGFTRIVKYRIQPSGAVTASDWEGRAYHYR